MMPTQTFWIAVDDGGFKRMWPDDRGPAIPFGAYENLLLLAQEFDLRVVVAFTMKFLDLDNVSGVATPLSYGDQLLSWIRDNPEHVEVADHGLTHQWAGGYFEFFNPYTGQAPPESEQREHVMACRDIWRSLDMPFPQIFIPPAHGWQSGVTDRLYAEVGTRDMITVPYAKVTRDAHSERRRLNPFAWWRPVYTWPESNSLRVLPRSSMGLRSVDGPPGALHRRVIRSAVKPGSSLVRRWLDRSSTREHVHSYMTHIGNFAGAKNLMFWHRLLTWVLDHPGLRLVHSHKEAVEQWLSGRST